MSSLPDQLGAELDKARADGLYRSLRIVTSAQGPRIRIDAREFLNFSSNDYLGLASDPVLKQAASDAIARYGVGAGASRLVCGNLQPYDELERTLAAFKAKEAAIVFSSGYAANVGTITALVGEGDVVILDKLDHASIIDGARQSGATIRVYPHKNLKKLEAVLEQSTSFRRKFIVTETVFSMDGDLAPLAEIVELKEKYSAWLMIDEAHATGLYAKNRRGIAEAAGVEDKIDVTLGTLSKALGCGGGFVVGSQMLIDFLRNRARSLIYSTALPPAVCAAAAAAVELVMSSAGQERRDRLWRNVSEMKNGLSALGVQNESRSPIIPIVIGDEKAAVDISGRLFERGIFVPAIRFPTVPKGKARLRVTVTAAHTEDDIRQFLTCLQSVGATFLSRLPHSADLRRNRSSIPGECYFITTCLAIRKPVLANPDTAQVVIDALRWLRDQGRIRLLGFVVMPDHLHVAFALRSRQECRSHEAAEKKAHDADVPVATLADIMKSLKGYTSRKIHEQTQLEGPLWQTGYHDHLLRDREDFEKRLQYMHENPVRARLANSATEYRFSSAHPEYEKEIDWAWLEGVR
ncbi:MAG TPA: 8-amino-7-oxononanoate synthase [Verrucomicrobiae bacterium]|nr:8-amino-7-oxononanoate synthase [Verrucomicrobiae bacterium]